MAGVYGRDETERKMMLFSSQKRRGREAAARLYAACVEASRAPALYRDYGVPDTLQGRFEMVALHLFPLLHRLMHEPGDDPELARLVSESFVTDMDAAFREMGVGDVTVPKRMKTLYASFAGRISGYTKALGEGDGALAGAIARNVFPDEPRDERALSLAAHVQSALAALRGAPLVELQQGKAAFPNPAPAIKQEAAI